ncbi:alanine/glycine:cation symporter family protein [Halorhodospira halophila]|uniref:Amino acid carrier protein n=1 Tax=Halorhodospira halophila (strain DSM 244 / SL1) TaxID=349124 RepID=A1WUN1_HALHL|nr:sodium:alanine symporter family protein [Halorhodospira halophila]ABM61393.1 amino acid carrier protein [Halorhodospira halophila SL1]MBK1729024.1 sodium:alanine symporter family protein [Halorhodospira halophila]
MEAVTAFLEAVSGVVWGPAMLVLLLGTGLYLSIGLRAMPIRRIGYGFRRMWGGRAERPDEPGEITPFQALTTALSATIGTGNIAGVATAITLGGPGAVFWMWITALVGMATKYAEAVLAVKYRETDEHGRYVGGPMYYIKNGLGPRWAWLGTLFAVFAMVAAFGIGNTVQANSVADVVESNLMVPPWLTGLILAGLVFLVIIGGIRRIARVAERLVPTMAAIYVIGGLLIIGWNFTDVPAALGQIVTDAFTGTAATGGFAGAAVWAAIRFGVARGIFSNEAGLGSAPIAHAAARTKNPVRQGTVAMLGTFIDTIIVCTITALAIVLTGVWTSGETGASLTSMAFGEGIPGGNWIVTVGMILFAFTTIVAWSYYGERCAAFLFGARVILPYRYLWVALLLVGAVAELGVVWIVADILNALMAIPNLIALLALSGTVFAITRSYFAPGGGSEEPQRSE